MKKKYNDKLRSLIIFFRKDKKMSHREVAEAIGVTKQTIAEWETGETYPNVYNALKLARLFDTSVEQIYILN